MKYLVIPRENTQLDEYQKRGADAFIFGIEKYSVNYPEVSLESLRQLSKNYSIWVALNKNIRNEELKDLETLLNQLSSFEIKGILFYDLAILHMVQRKKLKIPLVWHQTHMVTNYQTCNYYFNQGVSYGIVSNEITLEEILEIKKNTKMEMMVQVFGYPVVSEKQKESFFIKETHAGTTILFGKIINGANVLFDLLENDFSYAILDMRDLKEEVGIQILELYTKIRESFSIFSQEKKKQIIDQTIELVGDYTNFFYKKTIYKVK